MPRETEFIRLLQRRFPAVPPVINGIGDDGAVLACPPNGRLVVVTDMLLDGVHFDLAVHSAEAIGRKAIAVNLSDLAAMACRPTAAFISVVFPKIAGATAERGFSERLYDGIAASCQEYALTVAGGDTNSWNSPFAINVCLTGEPFAGEAVLRSRGQSGDVLCVTGPLGGSLHQHRHLCFVPRLRTAEWLVRNTSVRAMIDVSDGLAVDLRRLTEASGVGAVVDAERIPIHADVPETPDADARLAAALGDGEDFELLFAVPSADWTTLQGRSPEPGVTFHRIGELRTEPGCWLRHSGGALVELPESGWQHEVE